jgi:hypothetical protein
VSLDLEAQTPSIEWGDFGDRRFTEPFFDDSVARWAAQNPPPRAVRTDLDALAMLDQAPSLDPNDMIFHLSRSGSTLLARQFRHIPGCVVVSEPEILNDLLLADAEMVDEETHVELVRLLVRALGRRRLGDEEYYVVKLSSWNILKFHLFRRAFPSSRAVWVQRTPAEVIVSLLARPPEWLHTRDVDPALVGSLFGISCDEVTSLQPAALCVRALSALLRAAQTVTEDTLRTIDYTELPDAAWKIAAPLFGYPLGAAEIKRMEAEARHYSKDAARRLFERPAPDSISIPEPIQRLAEGHLNPLYRELSRRTSPSSIRRTTKRRSSSSARSPGKSRAQ